MSREKEGDLTQSFLQNPLYQQKIRKPKDNTQAPPKTSIKQRLRTDLRRSVGVTSHPTGVVEPVYGYPTFPLTAKSRVIKRTKCKKGKVTTQTTPQNSSIKQQLRTDLGRSVGVTTTTKLVWLTWFTGLPSHSSKQPCNQKDTHLKICK